MELPRGRGATRKRQLWKENEIEAKRNKMTQIKPKEKVCACAVAKLLLKVDWRKMSAQAPRKKSRGRFPCMLLVLGEKMLSRRKEKWPPVES